MHARQRVGRGEEQKATSTRVPPQIPCTVTYPRAAMAIEVENVLNVFGRKPPKLGMTEVGPSSVVLELLEPE